MSKKTSIEILTLIEKAGKLTTQQLADKMGLSENSIRRYLRKMEDDGLVSRGYGYVTINDMNEVSTIPFEYKSKIATSSKDEVAMCAAGKLQRGKLIYLDSGSSAAAVAKFINDRTINVVTPNLPAAEEMGKKGIRVFVLPGYINFRGASVYSEETYEHLKDLYFDQCIVSTVSVDEYLNFGTNTEKSARIKSTVIKNSKHPILIAEKTKYGKKTKVKFANAIDDDICFITDETDEFFKVDTSRIIEADRE